MKASELRQLSLSELQGKLDDAKEELFKLRFQMASGQLEDPNRLRFVRRDIARINTLMSERAKEESNA
jgi:large subunit ribosomal protein L29